MWACVPNVPSTLVHVPPDTGKTQVELRLPVSRGTEVSGRVLAEDGAGLPGIHVGIGNCGITQTEADGSFLFSQVADGTYTLEASSSSRAAAIVAIQVAGQPVRDVELRLGPEEKRATISGRILGVPPADLPRTGVAAQDSVGSALVGTVDLRGTYQIQGAHPEEWGLTVVAPNGRVGGTVQISQGQTGATLDLEVKPRLTLSGRVLLDGEPLARASFEVSEADGDDAVSYSSETAYDGSFRLHIREPASITLTFLKGPGAGTVRTLYLVESQEIVIELSSEPD